MSAFGRKAELPSDDVCFPADLVRFVLSARRGRKSHRSRTKSGRQCL